MHNKRSNYSTYIDESIKKIVAIISRDIGFESIDQAALLSLTNLLSSYLETLLLSTHSYAEIGNRIRPNYHDIQQSLRNSGVDLLALEQYAEQYKINNDQVLSELDLLKLERSNETTIEPIPDFLASDEDEVDENEDKGSVDETHTDSSYVPAYLPKFPSKHSFRQTPVYIDRPDNQLQIREINSQQSRTVEENLKRLMSTESELRRQKELGSRGGNGSLLGNLKVTPIVNYETALQRSKRAKKGKLE
ncbi:hypothetical protein BJ944DRAFT_226705 [Cunninghamella echinulata]|nr:hypothetical protein BJ944DRAFT_226705 [Cunninghamella echinulata]